ncbi:MAG: hypothetical protein FWD13_10170 [Treponema sp.]|nr:hypothetical protein [Treponema sp.]
MRNENDCLIQLNPVKRYVTPKYPVYTQASENPELLKKLPTRWQKNAKVISCLGAMGMLTLSSCFPPFFDNKCSKCGFSHHGGSGGAPIYIVYLTEEEALALIRTKVETAGLNLDSEPPEYSVKIWNRHEIGLNLYNEEKDVGVALVRTNDTGWVWCDVGDSKEIAEEAKKEFDKLENNTTIGVFYNPEKPFGNEPSAEAKEEAEELLREQLASQVQEFILWLQAEGIIQ